MIFNQHYEGKRVPETFIPKLFQYRAICSLGPALVFLKYL